MWFCSSLIYFARQLVSALSVASSQSELIKRTRWTPCGDLCSGTLPLSILSILCLHFVYNPFRMPPAAARLRHNGGSSLRLYSGAWATDPIHIPLPVSIIFLTSVAFIVLAWLLFLFHLLLFSPSILPSSWQLVICVWPVNVATLMAPTFKRITDY